MFLYKIHLHILQIEEYELHRFLKWVFKNFFKKTLEGKKKLVWTSKAKQIYYSAIATAVFLTILLTHLYSTWGLTLGIILASQDYIFLCLGLLYRKPYEIINRILTRDKTLNTILSYEKLKVIGISGSYAKTSTKDILYNLLKTQYNVLKTPLSYNNLFGITKVIEYELDNSYDFFICEMGEYKIGEVDEIARMVNPLCGIITGINEQHLERFTSLDNTIKAVFELADYIGTKQTDKESLVAINIDNDYIKSNCDKYNARYLKYGFKSKDYTIKNLKQNIDSTKFDIILESKTISIKTKPFLARSHLLNILAASTLALKLGVSKENIKKAISNFEASDHRLKVKHLEHKNILIDDSYSSNVTGFKEAIHFLKVCGDFDKYNKYKKIIVTPGIVELGKLTASIHRELGQLTGEVCDYTILVGKNERTQNLENGIKQIKNKPYEKKLIYIDSIKDVWECIIKQKIDKYIVLFENDLPDNY